jgi:hypothetical protein
MGWMPALTDNEQAAAPLETSTELESSPVTQLKHGLPDVARTLTAVSDAHRRIGLLAEHSSILGLKRSLPLVDFTRQQQAFKSAYSLKTATGAGSLYQSVTALSKLSIGLAGGLPASSFAAQLPKHPLPWMAHDSSLAIKVPKIAPFALPELGKLTLGFQVPAIQPLTSSLS